MANNYERRPNSGVLFIHTRGRDGQMYDGSLEADIETICPCGCGHKFTASGSFFMDGYKPKSEKVHANIKIKQKGVPLGQPSASKPSPESNRYKSQSNLNYAGTTPPKKPIDHELDDEIPF